MRVVYLNSNDQYQPLLYDEVHVWSIVLNELPRTSYLTSVELERSQRFKLERIRLQFIATRSRLRVLLGHYLQMDPMHVPLIYETSGKPNIDPQINSDIHFNVSHSEFLATIAVTRRGRVGIDVEFRRSIPNLDSLVDRFFCPRERDFFRTVPEHDREDAFFRAWTRKEAVLKAVGQGVQSLDLCDVSFGIQEPVMVLRFGCNEAASDQWFLHGWRPGPKYDAALAIEMARN